jgi:hypothetical protein
MHAGLQQAKFPGDHVEDWHPWSRIPHDLVDGSSYRFRVTLKVHRQAASAHPYSANPSYMQELWSNSLLDVAQLGL